MSLAIVHMSACMFVCPFICPLTTSFKSFTVRTNEIRFSQTFIECQDWSPGLIINVCWCAHAMSGNIHTALIIIKTIIKPNITRMLRCIAIKNYSIENIKISFLSVIKSCMIKNFQIFLSNIKDLSVYLSACYVFVTEVTHINTSDK